MSMSGIRAVAPMWLAILGWTLITGTVGLILRALQAAAENQDSPVARIVGTILISIVRARSGPTSRSSSSRSWWSNGSAPFSAIRRSAGMLRRSWGRASPPRSFSFLLHLPDRDHHRGDSGP